MASHELKTPLTSAKAYSQLLLEILQQDKSSQAYTYAAKTNAFISRLNDIISEMLDIAKIRHAEVPFTNEEFSLDELLNETVESLQKTSPKLQISKASSGAALVFADRKRIQQVIHNLISNAIKYSPDSNRIDIAVKERDDEVLVSVTDYGIG